MIYNVSDKVTQKTNIKCHHHKHISKTKNIYVKQLKTKVPVITEVHENHNLLDITT